MEGNLYEVAIGLIPGIGSQHTRQLVSYCGSAENIFKEKKGKLLKIPGIGEHLANSIINHTILSKAENEISMAIKTNTEIIFYTSPKYPHRLKHIYDAPTLIYYKGNTGLNSKKMIGVVGTRQATAYGKGLVEDLFSELAKYDVTIISGLAYGIDIAAHKAALASNLPTLGVMATGIDIIYPSAHSDAARKMLDQGGLITEYPFGTKPEISSFPARNRIIAGMSDAVIVIEAAEKGGALITAELANSYDREVFAFPGNIGQKYSMGCNKLIKSHKAHILTGVSDLEYIMNWDIEEANKNKKETPSINLDNLNQEEKEIVHLLQDKEGVQIDDLSWKSQIPIGKLASILLNLEFQGLVKSMPGKKFKLN